MGKSKRRKNKVRGNFNRPTTARPTTTVATDTVDELEKLQNIREQLPEDHDEPEYTPEELELLAEMEAEEASKQAEPEEVEEIPEQEAVEMRRATPKGPEQTPKKEGKVVSMPAPPKPAKTESEASKHWYEETLYGTVCEVRTNPDGKVTLFKIAHENPVPNLSAWTINSWPPAYTPVVGDYVKFWVTKSEKQVGDRTIDWFIPNFSDLVDSSQRKSLNDLYQQLSTPSGRTIWSSEDLVALLGDLLQDPEFSSDDLESALATRGVIVEGTVEMNNRVHFLVDLAE